MPNGAKILVGVVSAACLLCLIRMIKSGHFFKSLLTSSVSGLASLFAVNLISEITGVSIAVNWFTMIFCSFCGICGSIALLIVNVFV